MTAEERATAHPAPVAAKERHEYLDLLRGVAILCILPVNIISFSMPSLAITGPGHWGSQSALDQWAFYAVNTIFTMKFYTLLSFTFGVGLAMQTERVAEGGANPTGVYLRRLAGLFALGAVHGVFFWYGDILAVYAGAGLLVFAWRKLSTTMLFALGASLVVLPILLCCAPLGALTMMAPDGARMQGEWPATFASAGEWVEQPAGEQVAFVWRSMFTPTPEAVAVEANIYANGNWLEIAAVRGKDYVLYLSQYLVVMVPVIAGLMSIGVVLMRTGLFTDAKGKAGLLRKLAFWGLLLGLPGAAGATWVSTLGERFMIFGFMAQHFSAQALALGYLGLVGLVAASGPAGGLRRALGCVGRMALTNYLMHTVVFTTLFYGHGLGLFGRFGYADLMLFVAAMWAFQLVASPVWLARYRFGPVEWLWRSWTYGEWQPFRREA
ncbi:MAG: DUF418 domain-containing protein [Candidatus Sumerlaeia bacterium]|nr:DUF418 domain-containing protein [Candidatus Sumerlaeia bacterium]